MTLDVAIARERGRNGKDAKPAVVRVAIYARKSTTVGLDKTFNSIDAQRESCEAYIASQRGQGWVAADTYEDGGFSGGTMDRPGLDHLLEDIKADRIDAVVCYRVDRLSRSVLDFSRIMEVLNKHEVAFVSISESFNTATPVGRMMLNMIMTFAQYERELAVERVRDKMHAARRKGRFVGGGPPLGYDLTPEGGMLTVNHREVPRVRAIFELYLRTGSLLRTTRELNRRGWRMKAWKTKVGHRRGGSHWTKGMLSRFLSNHVYIGKVLFQGEIYPGLQEAIVDETIWQKVQEQLKRNDVTGGAKQRNKWQALLRGLVYCKHCGCVMGHTYTAKGPRRYRYYVCGNAQANGCKACPAPRVAAYEIETHVVEQVKVIGRDPELVRQTLKEVQALQAAQVAEAKTELASLAREAAQVATENRRLLDVLPPAGTARSEALKRLTELGERTATIAARKGEVSDRLAAMQAAAVTREDLERALADFTSIWGALTTPERVRVIELLVERVDYDGVTGTVAITYRPSGITVLAEEAGQ